MPVNDIAVIGAGISGLVAACVLSQKHNVTVFERTSSPGGHVQTTIVTDQGRSVAIDTGFIVFNQPNYPLLCRLFDMLDVRTQASNMSFSVHCEESGFEYNGANLNQFFSQRKNLLKPNVWGMLRDILRFNRGSVEMLRGNLNDQITVGEFLQKEHYSDQFLRNYLLPLGASIWSCHETDFRQFPIRFVIEFLRNHGLLQLTNRPKWRTVSGGSYTYVSKLQDLLGSSLRLNAAVQRVERTKRGVSVNWNDNQTETFDEVIMATHADTSMGTIVDPDEEELETLKAFPYGENEGCLHTDTQTLPKNKRAWASWNYRLPREKQEGVSISYNMNLLQNLDTSQTYCMSLNQKGSIHPKHVVQSMRFRHPIFRTGRQNAQKNHKALLRRKGISYCGAYWGYGFHEDGIRSALSVCKAFEVEPSF